MIYLWVYPSSSVDKYNHCSNSWIYIIILWAYCSFCYFGINPLSNPTPLCHYFIREIIHPFSNAWICQKLWIIIIALFLFICIISTACAYQCTQTRIEILMQSARHNMRFNALYPSFASWTYLGVSPCSIILVWVPWCMEFDPNNMWTQPFVSQIKLTSWNTGLTIQKDV